MPDTPLTRRSRVLFVAAVGSVAAIGAAGGTALGSNAATHTALAQSSSGAGQSSAAGQGTSGGSAGGLNGGNSGGGTTGGNSGGTTGGGTTGGANNGSGNANGSNQNATVSALVDAPGRYLNSNVTVAGVVGRVTGPRSFTLMGEDAIQHGNAGPNQVEVTMAGQIPDVPGRNDDNRLKPGDPVQVSGQFSNLVALDGKLGQQTSGVGYQGMPTIIGQKLEIAGINRGGNGGGGNNNGGANNRSGGTNNGTSFSQGSSGNRNAANGSGNGGSGNGGNVVALSRMIDNPGAFFGRTVTTAGVVGSVDGPRTITVYGEDAIQNGHAGPNRLQVILATPIPDVPGRNDNNRLRPGDPIQITGRFKNLVTINPTTGKVSGGVGYQGRPTLVATGLGIAAMANHASQAPEAQSLGK